MRSSPRSPALLVLLALAPSSVTGSLLAATYRAALSSSTRLAEDEIAARYVRLSYGDIQVGSPAQQFSVLYDTGSSDFLLPGQQCDSGACQARARYDPTVSLSAAKLLTKRTLLPQRALHAAREWSAGAEQR